MRYRLYLPEAEIRSALVGLLTSLTEKADLVCVFARVLAQALTIEFLPFSFRTEPFWVKQSCELALGVFLVFLNLVQLAFCILECSSCLGRPGRLYEWSGELEPALLKTEVGFTSWGGLCSFDDSDSLQ